MANLTDTTMFKKLNSQTAMYDADNVDFLIKGLSGTYAEKTSVYTKTEADGPPNLKSVTPTMSTKAARTTLGQA